MIEKLIVTTFIGLSLLSCSDRKECESQLKNQAKLNELHSDSTVLILTHCGGLDSLDILILKSPTIIEIVNISDFQEGKYDFVRLIADFESFRKMKLYSDLRTTYELRNKKFNSNDWITDSIHLARIFDLTPEDLKILKSVIADSKYESMTYSEALKEMNKIQIQNSINEIRKEMNEK